ncbi:ABC transporter ATP-binding protein [Curvibacter sp. HBC28]|uniref:ABC transporter ATP-binding protein n=1 Tax=Curvibacter microcysteis TaxID=3026419 RepID=A0ABT5MDE8_9BURK|nr:ABC transporter ATP-binding protein [Curvibacter sp. HBC28]MDD0814608.1 ABC transporter ATP-binding protein [Curvibacter sp. HBC28]
MSLLQAQDITRRFGGFTAVDGVSLSLAPAEVLGIAGTNGAGKSTLFASLAGQQLPDSGQIRWLGQDISQAPPHQRARAGLVRTFQVPREFKSLSVLDNLLVAAPQVRAETLLGTFWTSSAARQQERALVEKAEQVLEFLNLSRVRDTLAGGLSGGQKKLVELGRVLMLEPRCILLDEPFAGVNPVLIDEISERIRQLHARGLAFIIIEHHLQALKALAGRLIVMDRGRILAEGEPEAVLNDARVQEAYMGGVV